MSPDLISYPKNDIMKYTHFVGIDVSKDTLDYSVFTKEKEVFHCQLKNSLEGLEQFLQRLTEACDLDDLESVLFCVEHTGIYCEHVFSLMEIYGVNLWVESSLRIKKSMGLTRGKTDRIDAKRIAQFAYRYQDQVKLWIPERDLIKRLKHLLSFRTRTIGVIKSIKDPINNLNGFVSKEECKKLAKLHANTLKALEKDLEGINKKIDGLIMEDERLSYLFSIVSSVSNIGKVTAAVIIATTNEFKTITDGKKYACYAGVVPFEHQSGTSIRKVPRVSHMANKTVKTMLHMSALSAVSRPGEFRDYYHRKLEEGKSKMSVINAIRNKLVLRVFACVRDGRIYDKNYDYNACC